ncbi:Carboxypeptidase A5 [Manis pentadactyla]|nr:Carboxypeptidase A5 [Manis pentadactyla]
MTEPEGDEEGWLPKTGPLVNGAISKWEVLEKDRFKDPSWTLSNTVQSSWAPPAFRRWLGYDDVTSQRSRHKGQQSGFRVTAVVLLSPDVQGLSPLTVSAEPGPALGPRCAGLRLPWRHLRSVVMKTRSHGTELSSGHPAPSTVQSHRDKGQEAHRLRAKRSTTNITMTTDTTITNTTTTSTTSTITAITIFTGIIPTH